MTRFYALACWALIGLVLGMPAPVLAQAPAKIQIVVFGFPSLGAFMPLSLIHI